MWADSLRGHENHLIVLQGPLYLKGSMKQYHMLMGGRGGGTSSAVGQTGGGRGEDGGRS
jgi:hypothetical protein